jgi:hypothetical protein
MEDGVIICNWCIKNSAYKVRERKIETGKRNGERGRQKIERERERERETEKEHRNMKTKRY